MKLAAAIIAIYWGAIFVTLGGETIDFGFASLELPSASHDNPRQGIDSAVGTITSTDGTPTIHYDVGQGPTEVPSINAVDFLFLKTGKLDGYDYHATIHKSDPDQLSFFLIKPIFSGFWATVNTELDRDKVLSILLRLKIKKSRESDR